MVSKASDLVQPVWSRSSAGSQPANSDPHATVVCSAVPLNRTSLILAETSIPCSPRACFEGAFSAKRSFGAIRGHTLAARARQPDLPFGARLALFYRATIRHEVGVASREGGPVAPPSGYRSRTGTVNQFRDRRFGFLNWSLDTGVASRSGCDPGVCGDACANGVCVRRS